LVNPTTIGNSTWLVKIDIKFYSEIFLLMWVLCHLDWMGLKHLVCDVPCGPCLRMGLPLSKCSISFNWTTRLYLIFEWDLHKFYATRSYDWAPWNDAFGGNVRLEVNYPFRVLDLSKWNLQIMHIVKWNLLWTPFHNLDKQHANPHAINHDQI
jgi:hypothetical protein